MNDFPLQQADTPRGTSEDHLTSDPAHCLMSTPKDTSLFPNDLTLMSHSKTEQASLLGSQLAKGHHGGITECVGVYVRASSLEGRRVLEAQVLMCAWRV